MIIFEGSDISLVNFLWSSAMLTSRCCAAVWQCYETEHNWKRRTVNFKLITTSDVLAFKTKGMVGFTLDEPRLFTLDVTDDDGNTTVVTKIVPATGEVIILCAVDGPSMGMRATSDNKLLLVQTHKLLLLDLQGVRLATISSDSLQRHPYSFRQALLLPDGVYRR